MAGASASAKPSEPGRRPQTPKRKRTTPVSGSAGTGQASQASVKSDKFVHVHHYLSTGRWGTWFNDPRIEKGSQNRRLYFGTYETEYLAARAQDRAALMFKPYFVKDTTRLNFAESDYELDRELLDALEPDQFRKLLMGESRKRYKRKAPSPCLWKFLEEERAKGALGIDSRGRHPMQPRTISEILTDILGKSSSKPVVNTVAASQGDGYADSSEEDEGQVGNAKRTKRLRSDVAPEQPVDLPADTLVVRRQRSPRAQPVSQPSSPGVSVVEGELPVKSQSSETIPVTLEPLAWERTCPRSTRERLRFARAAAEDIAPSNLLLLANTICDVINDISNGTEEDRAEEPPILDPMTRGRWDIDLNCAPRGSSTADLLEPSNEAGAW